MAIVTEIHSGWRRVARRTAAATGAVTGGALLSTLGIAYYVARVLTDPKRPSTMDTYTMTPFETGADFEQVSFPQVRGGQLLHGWWFPRPETRRVIVGCHGYRSSKSELIGIATALWRAGFNVLLFDYHGHGAAIGSPVTLGYREVNDVFAALDYAERRVPDAEVGLLGFSMGASVAIIAASRRPEVRAVVADSPFAAHGDVVAHNISRILRVDGRPIAWLADLFIHRIAGYRSRDVEPERDVAGLAPRPLLIIHGTADETIPVGQAERVYAAAGKPKELWLGAGAPHCGTYFLDRPAYCARVIAFFDHHLLAPDHMPAPLVQHTFPTAPNLAN